MIVKEIYHKGFCSINPNKTVGEALSMMDENNVGALPVLDDDEKICGIISLQDIAGATVPDEFKRNSSLALAMNKTGFFDDMVKKVIEMKVSEIMRKDFLKVTMETNIMAVMTDFLLKDLYHVPVVNDQGKVIGIIARNEIKKALLSRM